MISHNQDCVLFWCQTQSRTLHSELLDRQHPIYQKSYETKDTSPHMSHFSEKQRPVENTCDFASTPQDWLMTPQWLMLTVWVSRSGPGVPHLLQKNNLKVHHSFSGLFVLFFFFYIFFWHTLKSSRFGDCSAIERYSMHRNGKWNKSLEAIALYVVTHINKKEKMNSKLLKKKKLITKTIFPKKFSALFMFYFEISLKKNTFSLRKVTCLLHVTRSSANKTNGMRGTCDCCCCLWGPHTLRPLRTWKLKKKKATHWYTVTVCQVVAFSAFQVNKTRWGPFNVQFLHLLHSFLSSICNRFYINKCALFISVLVLWVKAAGPTVAVGA